MYPTPTALELAPILDEGPVEHERTEEARTEATAQREPPPIKRGGALCCSKRALTNRRA